MTVLTAAPERVEGYGRVVRKFAGSDEGAGDSESKKALTPELAQAREINSGIYAFRSKPLFASIGNLGTNNAHGELYLTDMAQILGGRRRKGAGVASRQPRRGVGCKHDRGNDGDRRTNAIEHCAQTHGPRRDYFSP